MALKTEKSAEVSVNPNPGVPNTTVLELALYTQYTWGTHTYETGKPYRFKNSDAMVLLAEQDAGRPVWKLYKKPVQRQAPKNEIVDATGVHAPIPVDEFGTPSAGVNNGKRIEVGTDDEIADVLNRPDESGDVTV